MDKNRRTGRTTRLADGYIQDLFKDKKIVVVDHFQDGTRKTNEITSKRLTDIIMKRLAYEHQLSDPYVKVIAPGQYINSDGYYKIELITVSKTRQNNN